MPNAPRYYRPQRTTPRQHKPKDKRQAASRRGYDGRWHRLRSVYAAQNPLCEQCKRPTPMQEVDHVIPITGLHDPLRIDWRNLQSLCRRCHRRKTQYDAEIREEYERSGDAVAVSDRYRGSRYVDSKSGR